MLPIVFATMLFVSCAKEFNAVYKSSDYSYRYEYAKEQYARGSYQRASLLLGDMVTVLKSIILVFSNVIVSKHLFLMMFNPI